MPKKNPNPEAEEPASKGAQTKPSSGNTYNIQGGIHAKRDVNMGDQSNTYYQTTQTLNVSTPAEFIMELQKLSGEIERQKALPGADPASVRRLGVVEADIEDVIAEAEKEAPDVERIKTTLDGAKETMEKLGGSITAAVNLGTALGGLALLVWKVFGGG